MRQRFYELACDALGTVRYSLEVRKDGRLADRILVAMGVAPRAGERHAMATHAKTMEKAARAPFEIAEEEQNGHLRKVAKVAHEISAKRFAEIRMNDRPEEKNARSQRRRWRRPKGHRLRLHRNASFRRFRRLGNQNWVITREKRKQGMRAAATACRGTGTRSQLGKTAARPYH